MDKKVIQLRGDNYSIIINDIVKKFQNDFPPFFGLYEIIDFTIQVWNLTNFRNNFPKEDYLEFFDFEDHFENDRELFDKLVKYKNESYSRYKLFIIDFAFLSEDNEELLEVETGDLNDYMLMLEDELTDDEFDEDFEDGILDRNAVIINHRKKYLDWADMISKDFFVDEIGTNIYLIDDLEDCDDWLMENYEEIFEKELDNVVSDRAMWPQNRSYSTFKQWFKVDYSYLVRDMGFEDDDLLEEFNY
jgi:hypothetical protein